MACACALMSGAAQSQEASAADGELRVTAGVAVGSRPSFIGSDELKTRLGPILAIEYGRYFLGAVPGATSPLGLGVDLWRTDGVRLGVALVTDLGKLREESDDRRLVGLGDVKGTQRAALFGSYSISRFKLSGHVASDIANHQLGTVATLEAHALFQPTESLVLSAGPGITWHNRQAMQTIFGISDSQSAASGRPAYRPDAGVSQWQFTLGAMYRLDAHWTLGARAVAAQLEGDAADSPLVFQKSQPSFGVFTAYRF